MSDVMIIGIAGGSGSGKTTLAERLCDVSAAEQNQPLARAENPRVFCSLDDNLQLRRPIASGFVLYDYKLFSHPINPLAGIPSL